MNSLQKPKSQRIHRIISPWLIPIIKINIILLKRCNEKIKMVETEDSDGRSEEIFSSHIHMKWGVRDLNR